jgi:hypothetical protein
MLATYQNSRRSARQIEPFIRKHNIDMSELKPVIYWSFAEFFDREFRPGARQFTEAPGELAAFAGTARRADCRASFVTATGMSHGNSDARRLTANLVMPR